MSVYQKLQAARLELINSGIKKTGHNSYGGWNYYELGDFIPTVHRLFDALGLCGVVTFGETATLTIYDTEFTDQKIEFSTPIVYAEAAKGQPIQMLGSTHTYLRRYLWLLALELVEADAVDAAPQQERSEPIKIAPKAVKPPAKIEGKEGEWQLKIKTNPEADLQGWIDIVRQSVGIMLSAAKDEKDVMDIFKNNRVIFDRLKADSLDDHVDIMADFKKAKDGFKKEPA
jgi:hypothetical protein